MKEPTDRKNDTASPGNGAPNNKTKKLKLPPSMSDITEMMNDSYSEHHQLERYRLLIECYGAVSFEYNIRSDALGFDFWWHDGQQHIILVEKFLERLHSAVSIK